MEKPFERLVRSLIKLRLKESGDRLMKRLLRNIMRLSTGLSAVKLPLVCLTALALLSCNTLPKFPTKNTFEVDLKNNVCGMYEVVDFEKLTFKHVADLPIERCDGVFGFSAEKIGPVMNWSRDVIRKYKDQCK